MIRALRALLVSLSLSALAVSAGKAGQIHDAVRQGDVAAIEAAIASGADLEVKDEAMLTPLVIAVLEGREDVAALLIAGRRARPGATATFTGGQATPGSETISHK